MLSIQCNKNLWKDYYVPGTMLDLVNTKLNKTLFLNLKMYGLIVFSESLKTIFLPNNPLPESAFLSYLSLLFSFCISVCFYIEDKSFMVNRNWCTQDWKAPPFGSLQISWRGVLYSRQKDSVSINRRKHSALLYQILLRKIRLIITPTIKRRQEMCGHRHKGSQWQRSGLISVISAP